MIALDAFLHRIGGRANRARRVGLSDHGGAGGRIAVLEVRCRGFVGRSHRRRRVPLVTRYSPQAPPPVKDREG
jgi:hypothetical protein